MEILVKRPKKKSKTRLMVLWGFKFQILLADNILVIELGCSSMVEYLPTLYKDLD